MTPRIDEIAISAIIKKLTNSRLEQLAQMMGVSKSAVVRWAIEEYLAKKLAA